MNIASRPLKEIQFKRTSSNSEELEKIESWVQQNCMFQHNSSSEYFLLLPHPKHPYLGGQSFEEFTENCPLLLQSILENFYDEYHRQMKDEKWISEFDLENDFGFVLIAFL
jgi:hypothetical protein